jgi:hypothetical protein
MPGAEAEAGIIFLVTLLELEELEAVVLAVLVIMVMLFLEQQIPAVVVVALTVQELLEMADLVL